MTLTERIDLLRDGRIEQAGSPLEPFEQPNNQYVAGFLGSPPMNFIDLRISSGSMTLPDGQQLTTQAGVADSSYHLLQVPYSIASCRNGTHYPSEFPGYACNRVWIKAWPRNKYERQC